MTTATLPIELFQELADGPGELTQADDGKIPAWNHASGRMIMIALPPASRANRPGVILASPGGSTRIQDATDGPGTLTIANDGKALVWDDATRKFVMATVSGGDASTLEGHPASYFEIAGTAADTMTAHLAAADPHTQYLLDSDVSAFGLTLIDDADAAAARSTLGLGTMATQAAASYLLASGATTAATAVIQPFALGTSQSKIVVLADSTTAFRLRNAADSASAFVVDTTNLYFGIGTTPTSPFHLVRSFGVLPAGQTYLSNYSASGTGDAGGATDLRALQFLVSAQGTVNITGATAIAGDCYNQMNSGTLATQAVISANVRLPSAGNSTNAYGYRAIPLLTSTGSITGTWRAFEARSPSVTGAGTIATAVGIEIAAQKVTGVTTGRGVWQTGASDFNSLAGFTAFGSTTTPISRLDISGNLTASAWGTSGIVINNRAATFTDSSTAVSGTATNAVFNSFGQPTLAATNATVTTTNAATVYIANAPAAGTNQTITNKYALWVDAGDVRLDGNIGFFGVAPAGQAAAITQTYNATVRTFSAYTANDQSASYTGQDNAQAGSVYAKLTDLNVLRGAYETLRAFAENTGKLLNALIDDMQLYGLEQ